MTRVVVATRSCVPFVLFLLSSTFAMAQAIDAPSNYAEIGKNSFSNSVGVITVNQSSGYGNAQMNHVGVAVGKVTEVFADSLSAVTIKGPGGNGTMPLPTGSTKNVARVADSAFQGSRGIVQVNQIAGSGNAAANTFALGISVSSP